MLAALRPLHLSRPDPIRDLGHRSPQYLGHASGSHFSDIDISFGIQRDIMNHIEPVGRHSDVLVDFFVRAVRPAEGFQDFAIQGEPENLIAAS